EDGLKVCATDIDTYMKANLFTPFGMTASGYVWTRMYESHAADPHDDKGQPIERKKASEIEAARYAAAGLLNTTATDYAKFLIEIINPRPADRFRLEKRTIAEMVRPHIKGGDSPTSSRGLGWEV